MDSQSRNKIVWTVRVETKKYEQLEQKQNSMDRQSRNKIVWTVRVETKQYGQLEQKQKSMDSQSRNKIVWTVRVETKQKPFVAATMRFVSLLNIQKRSLTCKRRRWHSPNTCWTMIH